jgi:hypothetical protein
MATGSASDLNPQAPILTGEKVALWVTFTYKGYPCRLAHQKFAFGCASAAISPRTRQQLMQVRIAGWRTESLGRQANTKGWADNRNLT